MLDLEEFVSSIPPDLWEMTNGLTLSKQDKQGRNQSEAHVHEKKLELHTSYV